MAAKRLEHPALHHLDATRDIFRALLEGLTAEQAAWKPAPERFSVAEMLEHMSHVEAHYFRIAFDQILAASEPEIKPPEIKPYDQEAFFASGAYSNRDAEESLAHWEDQREENLEFLQNLEPGVLTRTALHPELGQFTLSNLLNEWAFHDFSHIRQLAELVRAQLYYPELGPFQAQYSVRP